MPPKLPALDENDMLHIPITPKRAATVPNSVGTTNLESEAQTKRPGVVSPSASPSTSDSSDYGDPNVRPLSTESADSFTDQPTRISSSTSIALSTVHNDGLDEAVDESIITTESEAETDMDNDTMLQSVSSLGLLRNKVVKHNCQSSPTLFNNNNNSSSFSTPKSSFTSSPTIPNRNQSLRTFKRRPSLQQLTKSQKAKIYEEEDDDDTIPNDSQIFNVPIASNSSFTIFQNSNALHSKEILRKAWNETDSNLVIPPSPLPGKLHGNYPLSNAHKSVPNFKSPTLDKNSSFTALSPVAQQLSTFYEFSSHKNADSELSKRYKTHDTAPLTPNTIDDLKIASAEKMEMLSITRPTWLPPKDKHESLKHEKEFQNMIKHKGKESQIQTLKREQHDRNRMIADARLVYLSSKETLTFSNVNEVRKFYWRSLVDYKIRYALFKKVLEYQHGSKFKENSSFLSNNTTIDVNTILEKFPEILKDPTKITSLISVLQHINGKISWNGTMISVMLIANGFTSSMSCNILCWINEYVLTTKFKEKFENGLNKNKVLKHELKDFKDDYGLLNLINFMKIIGLLKTSIIYKLVGLMIVYSDYKLFYAVLITILKHYHFGWNNLQLVLQGSKPIIIEDEELFWERVYGYYKKF